MIKNTDLFYTRAKEYQDKRKGIIDAYDQKIEKLEKAKGSQLYTEETQKAEKEKNDALDALKSEYREYFNISLSAMSDANSARGLTPPTQEQLAILQVLKMRDIPTESEQLKAFQKELDRAANACADNAMAISVINDIAKKGGLLRGYHTTAHEMSVDDADRFIDNIRSALGDFMEHDTSRAARVAADYHAQHYGTTGDERPLPKRALFEDKAGCFSELTHGYLTGDGLAMFSAAVDGE